MGGVSSAFVLGVMTAVGSLLTGTAAVSVRRGERSPGSRAFTLLVTAYLVSQLFLFPFTIRFRLARRFGEPLTLVSRDFVLLNGIVGLEVLIMVLWLFFTLQYTGYGGVLTRRRKLLLLIAPAVRFLFVLLALVGGLGLGIRMGPWIASVFGGTVTSLLFTVAPVFEVLYTLLLGGASAIVLSRATYRSRHLDPGLGTALVSAMLAPLVFVFLTLVGPAGEPLLPLEVTFALLIGTATITSPLLFVAVVRFDPFEVTPAVRTSGTAVVVDDLDEPVLITDPDGTIVDLNGAAQRRFDVTAGEIAGQSLEELFESHVPAVGAIDALEFEVPGDSRYYDVRTSEITDRQDGTVGYALVLTDITDQRLREQRLAVLNRIVRHNLRNEMDAVLGLSTVISDRNDVEHADEIAEIARELSALGDKARQIEEMMDGSTTADSRTGLRTVVEDVRGEFADTDDGVDLTADVPDVSVEAEPEILRAVVSELVENACLHNDADDPRVRITGSVHGDRARAIELSVADNGPGIPASERETILEGEENALRHGSGLGLWLVKWGVSRMGGDLSFAENDPRGTVVTIRLLEPGQAPETDGTAVEMTVTDPVQ